jgi:hypothetical protein
VGATTYLEIVLNVVDMELIKENRGHLPVVMLTGIANYKLTIRFPELVDYRSQFNKGGTRPYYGNDFHVMTLLCWP